jgi:uncharacterized protein YdcH (DUF465 family)/mannose-6-phosphate isomerase-like protein (cupin superfamily)
VELEHHRDLTQEFPGLRTRVHELKLESPTFRRLYDEYQAVDNEIYRIEQEIETPSDDYTEELKRRRVRLKDRLYGMLTGRIPPDTGSDEFVIRRKFALPVDPAAVTRDWIARGFSCRAFSDPPGQEWRDYRHDTNELMTVVDGRLEISMHGENWALEPGDELYIPRGVTHTVRNRHTGTTRWLYGYD